MAQRQTVAMLLLHPGTPRDAQAREQLAAALPGAEVGPADELGVFEIALEADDLEQALSACGTRSRPPAPTTTSSSSSTPSCPSTGAAQRTPAVAAL